MPSSRRSSSRNSAYPSDATITRPRSGRRDTRDLDSAPSSDDNDVNARALSRPGRAQRKADVISDDSDSMSDSSDSQSASATAQHDLEKGQNRSRQTVMRSLPSRVRGDAGGVVTTPKASRKEAKRNAYTPVAGMDNSDSDDAYSAPVKTRRSVSGGGGEGGGGGGGGYPVPGPPEKKKSFMTKARWIVLGVVVVLVLALIIGVSVWLYKKKDDDFSSASTSNSTEMMSNDTLSLVSSEAASHSSKPASVTPHTLASGDVTGNEKATASPIVSSTSASDTSADPTASSGGWSSVEDEATFSIQTVPNPTPSNGAPSASKSPGLSTIDTGLASQNESAATGQHHEKNPFSLAESTGPSGSSASPSPVRTGGGQGSSGSQDADPVNSGWSEPSATATPTALAPGANDRSSAGQKPSVTFLSGVQHPTAAPGQGAHTDRQTYEGQATWFSASQHVSTCNSVFSDSDMVAALQPDLYGPSGEPSPFCGAQIEIWNPASNKTISVSVQDECPLCSGELALDLSKSAFEQLGDLDDGIMQVQWWWVDPAMAARMPQTFQASNNFFPASAGVATAAPAESSNPAQSQSSANDGSWNGVTTIKNDPWGIAADQSRATAAAAERPQPTSAQVVESQDKQRAGVGADAEQAQVVKRNLSAWK